MKVRKQFVWAGISLAVFLLPMLGCSSTSPKYSIPPWAQVSKEQVLEAKSLALAVAYEDPKSGLHFVLIPGTAKTQPFYLGETEVTNASYRKFKKEHVSAFNDNDRPVNMIRLDEAREFCAWLGEGYRLPSEEEWEVACRAGTSTKFSFGDKFDHSRANAAAGDPLKPEPRSQTRRVRSYPPNQWGLYDMHGNVMEWCEPNGKDTGLAVRGGSWRYGIHYVESSARYEMSATAWDPDTGFRVARSLPNSLP